MTQTKTLKDFSKEDIDIIINFMVSQIKMDFFIKNELQSIKSNIRKNEKP